MRNMNKSAGARQAFRLSACALAIGFMNCSLAVELNTGNTDLRLRWDNTIRYNLGVRAESQDSRILNNQNYDESDSKFDKGDIVTNRLDILSEMDVSYQKLFGARVSGALWYDHAYRDPTVTTVVPGYSSSYFNSRYNPEVSRYVHGPSGEILDAFVWANLKAGSVPINIKVGRQTNYWGEGLFFGAHAISYSQAPTDGVKAVTSPGIETKEVFLPIGQISAKAQLTSNLSVAAQYFYEWKHTRMPYGGTYFGPADPFFEGPDQLPVAPNGLAFAHAPSITPGNRGNFGINARLSVPAIDSNFGFYYREFDDYQAWLAPQFLGATGPWRLVYPKNVKLIGLSFARGMGPVSFGSEISYRQNAALNATGVSNSDNEGPRGNTLHLVANGVYLLPQTWLSDTGSLAVELAYSRLQKVTSHPELFKGEGYNCTRTGTGLGGVPAAPGDRSDGCSSRGYLAIAASLTPQYLNLFPSWDLDIPLTVNYGIKGNAATAAGGSEKALTWSAGARMTYGQRHEFTLRYADSTAAPKYNAAGTAVIGGNGGVGNTDRGWVSLTYKTAF